MGVVAANLGLPIYAFNYKTIFELLGEGPTWKELVEQVVSEEDVRIEILKARSPKVDKQYKIKKGLIA